VIRQVLKTIYGSKKKQQKELPICHPVVDEAVPGMPGTERFLQDEAEQ
jgi:hypothetical protein